MSRIPFIAFAVICAVGFWRVCDLRAHAQNKPDMVPATITHHKTETKTTTDHVEPSCPAGYEGHFVDKEEGFDWPWNRPISNFIIGRPWGYTVCFSKEFMDKVRANVELLQPRPEPPRPA